MAQEKTFVRLLFGTKKSSTGETFNFIFARKNPAKVLSTSYKGILDVESTLVGFVFVNFFAIPIFFHLLILFPFSYSLS
jgi:hypothetical protein